MKGFLHWILRFLLFATMTYLIMAFITWDISFIINWTGEQIRIWAIIVLAMYLICCLMDFKMFDEERENLKPVIVSNIEVVEDSDFDAALKQDNVQPCYDIEKMLEQYFDEGNMEEKCL